MADIGYGRVAADKIGNKIVIQNNNNEKYINQNSFPGFPQIFFESFPPGLLRGKSPYLNNQDKQEQNHNLHFDNILQ